MSRWRDEWIEAFGQGWHSAPGEQPGDRRRAGLDAVAPLIEAATAERIAAAIEDERNRYAQVSESLPRGVVPYETTAALLAVKAYGDAVRIAREIGGAS